MSPCTHRNWYRLSDLNDEVLCERCLRSYPFPHGKPPAADDWAYRPLGAFSFPDFASGSYAVAFALSFMQQLRRDRLIWSTNLELGSSLEVDFAIMIKHHSPLWHDEEPLVTVLGEAKSDGRFEAKDIARLRKLRKLFPDALLVVATLRHALSVTERNAIARLAQPRHAPRRLERYWRPPVMVLTATELLGDRSAPECWEAAGGRPAQIAGKNKMVSYSTQVRVVADITAQIHLHLPPHLEWARRRQ